MKPEKELLNSLTKVVVNLNNPNQTGTHVGSVVPKYSDGTVRVAVYKNYRIH